MNQKNQQSIQWNVLWRNQQLSRGPISTSLQKKSKLYVGSTVIQDQESHCRRVDNEETKDDKQEDRCQVPQAMKCCINKKVKKI